MTMEESSFQPFDVHYVYCNGRCCNWLNLRGINYEALR